MSRSMSDRPEATLLFTCCDQQRCLDYSLEAALGQRGPVLEIILSDDASTDDSLAVLQAAAAAYRGPHHVRARGHSRRLGRDHFALLMEEASTDFIIMGHADDRMIPDRCAKLLETHRRTGASLVLSHARLMDDALRVHGTLRPVVLESPQFLSALAILNEGKHLHGYIGATMGWHREVYARFPRLDTSRLPSSHDNLLALRAMLLGGVAIVEEALVDYRYGGPKWHGSYAITPAGEEEIQDFSLLALAMALVQDLAHLRMGSPHSFPTEWVGAAETCCRLRTESFVAKRVELLQGYRPAWLPSGLHQELLERQRWIQLRWFLSWLLRRSGILTRWMVNGRKH